MFGKLLKHEFRAAGRIFLPVWAGLLVLGLLTNGSARVMEYADSSLLQMLAGIVIFLFVIGCIAVGILSIVTMVLRFRNSMLQQEGYLTHTLPVSVHQLIWSRLIVSIAYFALTILVILVSILVAVFRVSVAEGIREFSRQVFELLGTEYGGHCVLFALELLACTIAGGLCTCLLFYAAMSIGHSFADHKVLLSVAFYFALQVATQVLTTIAMFAVGTSGVVSEFVFAQTVGTSLAGAHLLLLLVLLGMLLVAAIYYILTAVMLKRRLNLG